MIVQTAPEGKPHFIITQIDHAEISGVFALHFGNNDFASLNPNAPMIYVAGHHDDGWVEVDGTPQLDPKTRLPYHLTQTPTRQLIETGNKSPDANEAHHPFSGIISSMHTYGLYHGRYGLSDKIYIDMIDENLRAEVTQMLDHERARQDRLKAQLRQMGHDELAEENVLFHNYKLLQFFDTLALYIQTVNQGEVKDTAFVHVPRALDDDVTVDAKHIAPGKIILNPWCFDVDAINVSTVGRYMSTIVEDDQPDDLATHFFALPTDVQTYTFTKA